MLRLSPGRLQGRLNRLQKEVGTTAAGARNVLQGFMGPDKPASKLSNQARAVAAQQGKVEVLRAGFATGKIKQADLARAEGLLQKMTVWPPARPHLTLALL